MKGGRADGHETVMKPFKLEELIDAVTLSIGKAN
jgi:hypothetical protein